MDDLTREQRTKTMSRIRARNTKPEKLVRSYLFSLGFRFRVNDSRYPGKPDIVLPKYRMIIFVNGCFWHQHLNCKYASVPSSNQEYWIPKLSRNIERDKDNIDKLQTAGWRVLTIWECELKKDRFENTMLQLVNSIIKS